MGDYKAEEISLLVDGELNEAEIGSAYERLRGSQGIATWECYHIIGDTLRQAGDLRPGFNQRFAARLLKEPTVLAPRSRAARPLQLAWAAAATIAAVGVVGWVASQSLEPPDAAYATAREATEVRAAQFARHTPANDYWLAHQEFSPAIALQGVRPYLRAVSSPPDGQQ